MSEKLIDELREAAGQHPLDAPMSLFARAADALEKLALRDFSVPAGILEHIEAALKRIENGHGLRRIPADPTDVDLVLAECRAFFEGAWPPFWLEKKTGEASGDKASGSDGINISDAPADFKRPESPPPAPPRKRMSEPAMASLCGCMCVRYGKGNPHWPCPVHPELQMPSGNGMTPAAIDVLAERLRQISAEGWTPEHDDAHNAAELGDAAACYALWAGGINPGNWMEFWPWSESWLKRGEPRRMLVKAGALILAEIERLDRQRGRV